MVQVSPFGNYHCIWHAYVPNLQMYCLKFMCRSIPDTVLQTLLVFSWNLNRTAVVLAPLSSGPWFRECCSKGGGGFVCANARVCTCHMCTCACTSMLFSRPTHCQHRLLWKKTKCEMLTLGHLVWISVWFGGSLPRFCWLNVPCH